MSKGPVRHIRLRAAVAYPSVTVALVAVMALALTSFGSSQVTALAATTDPTPTASATTDPTPTASATTDPTPTASATTGPAPAATTAPGTVASPTPGLGVSPGAPFSDHHVVARIEGPALPASYLPIDAPVSDASQFQTFRVRFRLNNAGTDPLTATPQLEYRPEGASGYIVVPDKPQLGIAFHVDREWVPSGDGTIRGPLGEGIAVADFRMGTEGGLAMTGHHSMGANPDQPITLPSGSYTEEEFTVTLSMDAKYLTGYDLRITNGGAPLTTDVATIGLGAPPVVQLSPGQRQGVPVVDPSTTSTANVTYPLLSTALNPPSAPTVSAPPAVNSPSAALYPLAAGALSTATYAEPGTVLISESGIKGSHSTMAVQCEVCHSAHTAKAPNLLVKPGSQSTLCLTCHNGTQAIANVQEEYDLTRPVNNPATREYYSHDAVDPTTSTKHTRSQLNEFGGLSNRHSECADCHNSHRVGTTGSTQTANGWDASASGPLAGVSGVSVVNSPTAGAAPAYTFLDGVTNPVTREYQLCFKCHSSFTTLLPNIPGKPSTDALDKAAEFNPANESFHPVEAAGKNGTEAMKASLAASSPNKLWNFNIGSTIRCLNCHASSSTPDTIPDPADAAGAGGSLPAHTSGNRGILLRNYLDRQLKPAVDTASVKAAYSAGDFALCYVCHGEAPFVDSSSNATNFNLHAKHLTSLKGGEGGTDIDKAGDGQGNAICAECHFRIHSTTNKVGSQVIPGSRLVNFAPNVQPFVAAGATSGTLSWTPGATSGGTCTLTCHGQPHDGYKYN
jgi:predicted CXXCH cytochrome family protein